MILFVCVVLQLQAEGGMASREPPETEEGEERVSLGVPGA